MNKSVLYNTIYGVAILVFSASDFFSQTKQCVISWMEKTLRINLVFCELLLILFLIAIIIAINYCRFKYNQSRSKNQEEPEPEEKAKDYILAVAIDDSAEGKRIEEFQNLLDSAKKEVLIMGIGMGYVSLDTSRLRKLLMKGVNINLLMFNPEVIIKTQEKDEGDSIPLRNLTSFLITSECMDEFYNKIDYKDKIQNGITNFKTFIDERKQFRTTCKDPAFLAKLGKIDLRLYRQFVPMNVSISDRFTNESKLIIEFCLPFTSERIRSCVDDGYIKGKLISQFNALWEQAESVASDTTTMR